MLNEEEKKIVEYLRMSPKYSLKRDAANLIERLSKSNDAARVCIEHSIDQSERLVKMNSKILCENEELKNNKSSIWQAIKDKFK